MGFKEGREILLALVGVDAFPPFGFDLEEVCSRLMIASVSRQKVIDSLKQLGYSCMKQPLENSGIKTDAEYTEVLGVVQSLAAMPISSKRASWSD